MVHHIRVQVPGKLFLAGEYAVTHPFHRSLVFSVDRFLNLDIQACRPDERSFQSQHYQDDPVSWRRVDGLFKISSNSDSFKLLESIIQTCECYIQECGKELASYQIKIHSQLDHPNGKKYGLGSSGALSIALVKGLLSFYGMTYDHTLVFKLASLGQMTLGLKGSFGDLAASSFTGLVLYQCFDKALIQSKLDQSIHPQNKGSKRIKKLVNMNWPGLSIKRISVAEHCYLAIGWTGQPASTDRFLDRVHANQHEDIDQTSFLTASNAIVDQLTSALQKGQKKKIKESIQANQDLLDRYTQSHAINYRTEGLQCLLDLAKEHGGVAKISGAGGGDCGLALFNQPEKKKACQVAWKTAGIEPLDLNIYLSTEEIEND